MNKLYNTQSDFAIEIENFLKEVFVEIRKTQLNIIPYICFGMINAESSVARDIAKHLKDDFTLIQHESVVKRIRRFFSNKLFEPYVFYETIIKHVIENYKSLHENKRVHIVFDHMFSHDNFTVFMVSMRIGKQGIPLWFRCFEGDKSDDAFSEKVIKEGIATVSNYFDSSFNLVFLADRWFGSTSLMKHIEDLGHTYCIRLKSNIKVSIFDNKKNQYTIIKSGDLKPRKTRNKQFSNVTITEQNFKTNVVISKKTNDDDGHWIIATNGDTSMATKDYCCRFGGVESLFKNQKSNGFYIESTVNASETYFTNMYTLVCFNVLFLTITGAYYNKNFNKMYQNIKLETHKFINGKRCRVLSLFNIGLTLVKTAFYSLQHIKIPYNFTLYDV